MKLTPEDIRAMARAIDLPIPDDELASVAIRVSSLLDIMDSIERELGPRMDTVDPVPPVFPPPGSVRGA